MTTILHNLLGLLPDSIYIQMKYFHHFHRFANLTNPQTFNEKLQWLKLHDRNPLYPTLVDKYAVKKWVADKIGRQYIIPTLGAWNTFDEIDFDKLPAQFVLKTTHDSGGVVICRDKTHFYKQAARKKLTRSLKHNYYYSGREWPYKNVPHKIIAEAFIGNGSQKDITDYKFFCFNAQPVYCQVITDRTTQERVDFFDMQWQHQPFTGLQKPFPHALTQPGRPACFDQMKQTCTLLAKDIPFARIDFYEVDKKMYFGEVTFFPASGFGTFTPNTWNKVIGNLLKLPTK